MRALLVLIILAAAAPQARADTLYVVDRSGTFSAYDSATCAVIDQQKVGYRPEQLAYDATRDAVFVSMFDFAGTVVRYDRATATFTPVASVGALVVGLAVHPSGDQLFILSSLGLHLIDLTTGWEVAVLPLQTRNSYRFLRMDAGGSVLVGIDDQGWMTIFDPAARTSEHSRSTLWSDTTDVIMDPLNRDLMSVSSSNGPAGLYQWPGEPLRWYLDSGYFGFVGELKLPAGLAVSPNGQERYVATGDDEILTYRCSDPVKWCNPIRITRPGSGIKVGRRPTVMSVTLDGQWLFVGNEGDKNLSKVNIADRTSAPCGDLAAPAIDLEMGR